MVIYVVNILRKTDIMLNARETGRLPFLVFATTVAAYCTFKLIR